MDYLENIFNQEDNAPHPAPHKRIVKVDRGTWIFTKTDKTDEELIEKYNQEKKIRLVSCLRHAG